MKKMYMRKAILAAAVVAMAGGSAMAEGTWRNVNYLLKNPAFIPGWSGALTDTKEGIGESYDGAFELYQVLPDVPAGEYTLTANALYRCGNIRYSLDNMKDGANHNAYLFLGDAKAAVCGLFDNGLVPAVTVWDENNNPKEWGEFDATKNAPNGLSEAALSFAAGKYVNSVKFNHAGGDLRLGIYNLGGRQDEWTAFDNFKLVGPNGEVAIPNGDFAEGLNVDKAQTIWDCLNVDSQPKGPDANKAGGVYRKTNASPYNIGQQVELEAGKYRFGVQSFLRYGGAGNVAGKYVTCKGQWGWVEEESSVDRHANNTEADHAYIWVTDGWDQDDYGNYCKPTSKEYATDPEFGNPDAFYIQNPIKCLFDEELSVYPDNEPTTEGVTAEGYGWCDSGFEYQAAKCFVNNLDKYRNYVEFELPAKTKVWVGIKKDKNAPTQWWNPFRDFTLEKYDNNSGVNDIIADEENAPVEYYTIQGIRVNNPANGLYIVKQGKKVSKQIIK